MNPPALAGGREERTVGRETDRMEGLGGRYGPRFLAFGDVPDAHRLIGGHGGKPSSVPAEVEILNGAGVAGERGQQSAACDVPQPDRLIPPARGEGLAVG